MGKLILTATVKGKLAYLDGDTLVEKCIWNILMNVSSLNMLLQFFVFSYFHLSFNYRTRKGHKGRGFFQSTSQSLLVISVFLRRDLGGYEAVTQGKNACLYPKHAYAPTEPVQAHCKGNTKGAILKQGRNKTSFLSHSYILTAPHDNEYSARISIKACISSDIKYIRRPRSTRH